MKMNEFITFDEGYKVPEINQNSEMRRIGEIRKNNFGSDVEIVEYYSYDNITVKVTNQLSTGEIVSCILYNKTGDSFMKGKIESPLEPRSYGVGYIGIGPYSIKNNRIYYNRWMEMLRRCYSNKVHERLPGYTECYVNIYFHNFQNFCYWCDCSYYEVPGERMCLDKDILYYGNKEYSPTTCIFVPNKINTLFLINKSTHDDTLPLGVHYDKARNKYGVKVKIDCKSKFVGRYNTKKEAAYAYKNAKEDEIKRNALIYQPYLPPAIFEILMNYQIPIINI